MATIANLDINLGAKVAGFEKGMKTAQGAVGKLKNNVNSASGGMGASFTTMAKGAAMAAAGALAAQFSFSKLAASFDKLDKLSKTSETLGIATEELTAMHLAADMAGADVDLFDKAVFKMGAKLSEAAEGSKEARKAFEGLGLNVSALAAMKSADQFAAVADAIAGMENPQQAAAAAMDLFGKSAQDLMPLLKSGGGAIRQAQEDIDKFGFAANNVEAKGVEMAMDKLSLLGVAFTGIIDKIAVEAAPVVSAVADMFLEAGFNARSMGDIVETSMEVVKLAIAGAANAWAIWGAPIKIAIAAVSELVSVTASGLNKLAKLANSIKKTEIGTQMERATADISKSLHKFGVETFDNAITEFQKGITFEKFTETMARFDAATKAVEAGGGKKGAFGPHEFDSDVGDKAKDRSDRPAAVERGTAAAASAILKAQQSQMRPAELKLIEGNKKIVEVLTRIDADIKRGGLGVAAI